MKQLSILTLVMALFLSGCDLLGGAGGTSVSPTTVPTPVTTWGNMTKVANTYDYSAPMATIDDFMRIGIVGATPSEMCIVVWESATRAYAICRNLADNGQWPATCAINTDSTVSCGVVSDVATYFMTAAGVTRTLTVPEAELADEVRRQSYCVGERLDGSPNPCAIL